MSTSDLLALLGLLLALLTGLVSGFAFIWSETKSLESRVRRLEDDAMFLKPWVRLAKQKLEEGLEESFP